MPDAATAVETAIAAAPDALCLLPDGWRWVRLRDVCELNPRRPEIERANDALTSFVPMAAVAEDGLGITAIEERPYSEVRRGYTYLAEGDVLFAKITPCMQNGKIAIADDLIDGVGFGSTEFHVIRPGADVTAEWLHAFLRQPQLLSDAASHMTGAVGQQRLPAQYLSELSIPLPPLTEQRRIAAILAERMAAVERARAAAEAQLAAASELAYAYLRQSLEDADTQHMRVGDCTVEVTAGVGPTWEDYRLVGATRAGIAPAKESVGKQPERYKLVEAGTIFYNPMRILLGSIAMIDEGEEAGITSPDYVVLHSVVGVLHPVWFYHWLRSPSGEAFIKTLARGAVRERMLYRRLAGADIELPPWDTQVEVADRLRTITRLKAAINGERDAINALPAALLRQAFNGEL